MENQKTSLKDFVRPKRASLIGSVILALCGVFLGVLPYIAAYQLLMGLVSSQYVGTDVLIYAAVILGCFALQLLCHYASTAISHTAAFSITEDIRLSVTKKMLKMPLGYTQAKGSGYFKNTLMDELERMEYPLAHAIPETTSGVLLPLVIMITLFFMDWRMGLAVAVPAIVTLLFYLPMYLGIMNEFVDTYYGALNNMNSRVIEYISGIKEIKIFGRTKDAYSKYEGAIDQYKDSTLRLYFKMYLVTSPAMVLLSSILVSVLCVGGALYCAGTLSVSVYLFTIVISIAIGAPLLKLTEFMDNFFSIQNGMHMVQEILSAPEIVQNRQMYVDLPNHEVAFENVSFAYEDKEVLKDFSLVFHENQKTALVGPSGSGKTTIANLIARFWDVTEGKITMGGTDYRDIPLAQLMENINYVTQDPFLFNISIRENLKIGKPNATDDEVEAAAEAAQCAEFISKLEHGYDTIVGDAGAKLSGGQRQRLIIARAILRNAPILILDEATAFSDMENQQKLQLSLNALCKDKTLIIIAHRLSTILDCDQIAVVDNGRLSACGTHEELLQSSELYRNMWEVNQASIHWSVKSKEVETC